DLSGVVCSQLCVQSLDSCPESLQPDCPAGQSFCADGQCHDECTDVIQALNPCHCSRSGKKLPQQAVDLIPCMLSPNVTIHELRPWRINEDTRSTCGDAVGIADQSRTVGVWGKTWIGGDITALWAECPAAPTPNYKYDESYWVATFAVNGALALLIAIWSAYKSFAERKMRSWSAENKLVDSNNKDSNNALITSEKASSFIEKETKAGPTTHVADTADGGVRLWGYRSSFLGTACVWGITTVTVLWICFLGVWTADYYGSLPGKRHGVPYSLSLNSSFLELATFLILWAICFVILIALFALKPHLRNYFRIQTLPSQGQFICIERTLHEIKMLIDESTWIQKQVNRLTDALVVLLSRDREYTTCPVSRTTQGRQYFTYQCTRYVYDTDMQQYSPFEFDLGTSNRSLLAHGEGLTSEEAAFRLELVGPNFIEVKVPGVFAAFVREFMSNDGHRPVSTCHAVTDLNGTLIGNPVDVEQFRASGGVISPESEYLDTIQAGNAVMHIVRRFQFVHARASMSVAVLDSSNVHVFVKGSFERIKEISRPGSLPADYDKMCADLAREGCYVLAIAHKLVNTPLEQLHEQTQDEVESGCEFAGLLVFKNMLKPDTEAAIAELKHGSTRTVMITGDTALTGVYIARKSGLMPSASRTILGESANPNRIGCAFRLNCGTPSVLESLGYPKPTWYIEPYNNILGHNVIPKASRYKFWGYCIGNMLATNLWQVLVVNGPVRSFLRKKRPLRRLKVKL
ncbi:hypothetical protein FB639_002316, partial [Coemansia asiatica]